MEKTLIESLEYDKMMLGKALGDPCDDETLTSVNVKKLSAAYQKMEEAYATIEEALEGLYESGARADTYAVIEEALESLV